MKRSNLTILGQSRSILGVAFLSASMAIVGCAGNNNKKDKEDDESSSEEEEDKKTSGKDTKSGASGSSGATQSMGSGTGSKMGSQPTGSSNTASKSGSDTGPSAEKAPDPKTVSIEISMDGQVSPKGQLGVTFDLVLGLATSVKIGANLHSGELKLTNGKGKLTLSPPAKDIDLGGEKGKDFYGLFVGTVYDDVNKNGKRDAGELIIGATEKALLYSRHGNDKGWEEWQEITHGSPLPIEGPFKVVRLDNVEAVTTLDLRGKLANLGVDVSHLTSITYDESVDLKKHFNATARPISLELDKNVKAWSVNVLDINEARKRKGGYPMIFPGMKNPGVEFPIGFMKTQENAGEFKADTKYTHLCVASGGGTSVSYTALMLGWIDPTPDWIEGIVGADIAARFGYNPGWNVLGAYVNLDGDYVPVAMNEVLKDSLHTSKRCYLKLADEAGGGYKPPAGAVHGLHRLKLK